MQAVRREGQKIYTHLDRLPTVTVNKTRNLPGSNTYTERTMVIRQITTISTHTGCIDMLNSKDGLANIDDITEEHSDY